jgi:para-nitrobenzyl esterase
LISQSIGGPLLSRQTLAEEQEIGVLLARQIGYGAEVSAKKLRAIPAGELVEASKYLPADHYFDAVIDGKTVVRHPLESLRRARAEGVDLIAGSNADEWYMYLSEDTTHADLEQWISENVPEQREALLALVADEPDYRHALDLLRTGRNMLCPSRFFARRVNASGGRAWVYHFTHQRSGSGGELLRAYHGIELPYVFNQHDDWLPTGEVDRQLTDAVMDYWVQFASTGDPNLPGRPQWPVHSRQSPAVLELGERIGVEEPRNTDLCDLVWSGSVETGENN